MIKIKTLTGDDEAAHNLEEEGRDGEEEVSSRLTYSPPLGSSLLRLSLITTIIYHGVVSMCFPGKRCCYYYFISEESEPWRV